MQGEEGLDGPLLGLTTTYLTLIVALLIALSSSSRRTRGAGILEVVEPGGRRSAEADLDLDRRALINAVARSRPGSSSATRSGEEAA